MFQHQISFTGHHFWEPLSDCYIDVLEERWWGSIENGWKLNLNISGSLWAADGDAWTRAWGRRRCRSLHNVQRGEQLVFHLLKYLSAVRFNVQFWILSLFRCVTPRTPAIATWGTGTSTETTWTGSNTWYTPLTTSRSTTNRTFLETVETKSCEFPTRRGTDAFQSLQNQYHCWNFCHVDVKYY